MSFMNTKNWMGLTAALLLGVMNGAKAQNPIMPPAGETPLAFDNLDWLTDRGQNTFFGPSVFTNGTLAAPGTVGANATGQRPGYSDYNLAGTSPGPAIFRWTFPFNYELPLYLGKNGTGKSYTVLVDNSNSNFLDKIYTSPQSAAGLAHSYLLNLSSGTTITQDWVIPGPNNAAGVGGVPFPGVDPALGYYGDYAYTKAVHNDFITLRDSGASPATAGELAALPNASPAVYTAVNNALIKAARPVAIWTSGPLIPGRYNISLYSPGAGYTDQVANPPIVWPNVTRAFVRVSWGQNTTSGANNTPDTNSLSNPASAINSPQTSRIFEINLQTQEWIPLTGGGYSAPATFPCDGSLNDQLVVTLYSLTPDNLNAPLYNGNPPTITADAVRFTLQQTVTATTLADGTLLTVPNPVPGLILKNPDGTNQLYPDNTPITISPVGRILGSPIGTGKLTKFYTGSVTAPVVAPTTPLLYFAREEYTPDTIKRSYFDPTTGTTPTPDPTSPGGTVPFFYCIDNKNQNQASVFPLNGNPLNGTGVPQITSAEKVIWRYVADAENGTGTSYSSPLLANVRCRDGLVRSMIYFATTSGTGRAHIYALDPLGDIKTHTTHAYWEYPSNYAERGLVNDPNIINYELTGPFAALNGFGGKTPPDQSITFEPYPTAPIQPVYLYDEYINPYTGNLDPKRQIPFGGVKGTPLLVDDRSNPTGPQLLVVPSLDGHIYTFDAGGRGDFGLVANSYVSGTTQRIWTWPRLAADREYFYQLAKVPLPVANAVDVKNNFPILIPGDSPLPNQNIAESFSNSVTLYDATSSASPLVIGSDYGHIYTLFNGHESFDAVPKKGNKPPTITDDTRRLWTFPTETANVPPKAALGAISGVTVYQPGLGFRDQYVFSAAGRVYSIFANDGKGTQATTGELAWAYPNPTTRKINDFTLYDPSVPDPNDDLTTPFDVDFLAAPVVVKGLKFNPDATGDGPGASETHDICYALRNDGTLYALDANPTLTNKRTRLYAISDPTTGSLPVGNTIGSPIVTRITPEPRYFTATSGDLSPITLVFGDEDGNIFGFKAIPELPPDPLASDVNALRLTWEHADSELKLPAAPRPSAAALVSGDTNNLNNLGTGTLRAGNGLLLQGDENGVLWCYSFGDGADGRTATVPPDQLGPSLIGNGTVAIDMRGVNVFSYSNFNKFDQTGGKPNTASPFNTRALAGNIQNNGSTDTGFGTETGIRSFEWGDSVYVAAWGLYYAQPSNAKEPHLQTFGVDVPQITVTFTNIPGTGRTRANATGIPVPGMILNNKPNEYGVIGDTTEKKWPADVVAYNNGLPLGALNSIWGLDTNDPDALWNQVDAQGNPLIDPATKQQYQPKESLLKASHNGNIFPWVAVLRLTGAQRSALQIIPKPGMPYPPGASGIRITAYATITQTTATHKKTETRGVYDVTIVENQLPQSMTSPAFYVGQLDADGRDSAGPQDGKPVTGRGLYIANPLALTTRGTAGVLALNGLDFNVLGWASDISRLPMPGEVLANGNRVLTDVVKGLAYQKPLFAPMGSIENNTSGPYLAFDGNGLVPALYAGDRSNYTRATGLRLQTKGTVSPMGWRGGPSSVMNPLPWEQIPLDGVGSADYPNLGGDRITLKKITGEDLLAFSDQYAPTLEPPTNTVVDNDGYAHGILTPTEIRLNVNVPKYFPANMNFGTGAGIGAAFQDSVSGTIYGDPTQAAQRGAMYPDILGPLNMPNGLMVGRGTVYDNPSGGFIGSVSLSASVPGVPASGQSPYRRFTVGAGVAPALKMRIDELTIDLGKLPQGGGYSDLDPNRAGGLRTPFNPGFVDSAPYNNLGTTRLANALKAFYDAQNAIYFRPFTLYNEGNVNLVDVRIEKLTSVDDALKIGVGSLEGGRKSNGFARAVQIQGDSVSDFGVVPLFALGFDPKDGGVGNIGIASSVDHDSDSNNMAGRAFRETTPFPIPNFFVHADDTNAWDGTITSLPDPMAFKPHNNKLIPLAVSDETTAGAGTAFYDWRDNFQPQPTIHKPHPGDSVGTIMTLPDIPYGHVADSSQPALKPMIGIAVPLGTPAGTYSTTIHAFEDNTPFQLRVWKKYRGEVEDKRIRNHDAIMNQLTDDKSGAVTPIEHRADPGTTLRFSVTEARLTNAASKGSLGAIDPINDPLLLTYPGADNYVNNLSLGASMLPAAIGVADGKTEKIALYMTTNRQLLNSDYFNVDTHTPKAGALWALSYSTLNLPYSKDKGFAFFDATFARGGKFDYDNSAKWWTEPTLFVGSSATIGNGVDTRPVTVKNRFPSYPADALNGEPYLTGDAIPQTERHGSPAITSNGATYLFWQGTVDKLPLNAAALLTAKQTQIAQIRDSRTFYQQLGPDGAPFGTTLSFLNDPALTKLSPKPLLINSSPNSSSLFLFWHTGGRGQTALYYNVNSTANFPASGWSRDQKLPIPGGVAWQSDPSPVFRSVTLTDPTTGMRDANPTPCIDLIYTGALKNRANAETLLGRYAIVVNATTNVVTLKAVALPRVYQEVMARVGNTGAYEARDLSWLTNAEGLPFTLEYNSSATAFNPQPLTTGAGRFDSASGLVYYNSTIGGQVVVDARTGRVTLPNVPLKKTDFLYASYAPQIMRVSVNRDDTGSITTRGYQPVRTTAANTYSPVVFLDRTTNPRSNNTNNPVDRMWVFYRKSDPTSGSASSAINYKTMRLMVRIPDYKPGSAINAQNASEVDTVRGIAFYTQDYEGAKVTVSSGNFSDSMRVAWRDELGSIDSKGAWNDTSEVILPSDSQVNEGQVTAFKDPIQDKVWVFWTSSRNGMSDLYYETISPQFYASQNY